MEQNRTPLFTALKNYNAIGVLPFDVPGHKRGNGNPELAEFFGKKVLEVDVNSMKELDNIGNPIGVIKEAEELLAKAYSAEHGFFLINGTTGGVQAMIMSACNPGDKIIIPRNAHKSAINGLILSGAIPVYIQPETSKKLGIAMGVTFESIKKAIDENEGVKAIFLINPTYYGAVSEIKKIIDYAHKKKICVLVDEAHGAHFKFHSEFPYEAMEIGADMAAVSLHKTGGSLTQSSALLLNEGLIDRFKVKTVLNLTQTTSASYLLMSSIDVARKNMAVNGEQIFTDILFHLRNARNEINKIDGLYAFGKELIGTPGVFDFDESKLGVNVSGLGLTGFEVYDILREEYRIQVELADVLNILAVVSIGDSKKSLAMLVDALKDISRRYKKDQPLKYEGIILQNPDIIVSPRNAFYARKKRVLIEESAGQISGESIMIYPPGIPIITPGERITKEIIDYIKFLKKQQSMITDIEDSKIEYIKVLGI